MEGKRKIAVWPCDTWCDYSDIEEFMFAVGLSDDYAVHYMPEELNDDEIEDIITRM